MKAKEQDPSCEKPAGGFFRKILFTNTLNKTGGWVLAKVVWGLTLHQVSRNASRFTKQIYPGWPVPGKTGIRHF
ncbi:MAG: hypothetical protein J5I98_22160 [Phaeodactylibacter sp.]|nr:hypothetical protein [Phaeodactylibacter sp.]